MNAHRASLLAICALVGTSRVVLGAGEVFLKAESFDHDPGWEGHNNRIVPAKPVTVKQDFGYSPTNFAGKASGELGGRVQRCTTPASYAVEITPKTLNDKLSASGTFALTASQPGAGLFFGFFNATQPGGSGRPIGSLGMDFDFEGNGGRLAVRMISQTNKSCGTFITPFLPGKHRPTPIKNDGTRYRWTLDYDPQGGGGNGRFTFALQSDGHPVAPIDSSLSAAAQAEERARFPQTTTFTVDVPAALRAEGATFDRFGMHNMMKAGGAATMFFDDLTYNGAAQDFTADPQWIGSGNRVTFKDRELTGAHQFGFSDKTNFAGGSPGEVGGGLWRSGPFAFYADRVGPLDLQQKLEARGKVRLVTAGPDSDICLGWFNRGTSKQAGEGEERNFVGVHIGGPTRVGHYFTPRFAGAAGSIGKLERAPILTPGKVFEWSILYDPEGNGGLGELKATLGGESATLPLKPGQKAEGAQLDAFGMFSITIGGQMVKAYFDDLTYTARRP